MSCTFDLEGMKPILGDDVIELPKSIKVHWYGRTNEFDFEIKFISKRGVGFTEYVDDCPWCGLYDESTCVMPDGTRICAEDFYNKTINWQEQFVDAVLNWVNGSELKITDEVEFMDI